MKHLINKKYGGATYYYLYGSNIKIRTLDGTVTNTTGCSNAIVLNDGTIISFEHVNWESVLPTIRVDVNGRKGPNQFGKDIFFFQLSKKGLSAYNYFRHTTEQIRNKYCTKNSEGRDCAVLLQENNWKFPKNYPW